MDQIDEKVYSRTKFDKLEERYKWAKVRWEFMRRSPEYRKDYDKAEKAWFSSSSVLNKQKIEENDAVMIGVDASRSLKDYEICSKYGLDKILFNPDKSFDELARTDSPDSILNAFIIGCMINPPAAISVDTEISATYQTSDTGNGIGVLIGVGSSNHHFFIVIT